MKELACGIQHLRGKIPRRRDGTPKESVVKSEAEFFHNIYKCSLLSLDTRVSTNQTQQSKSIIGNQSGSGKLDSFTRHQRRRRSGVAALLGLGQFVIELGKICETTSGHPGERLIEERSELAEGLLHLGPGNGVTGMQRGRARDEEPHCEKTPAKAAKNRDDESGTQDHDLQLLIFGWARSQGEPKPRAFRARHRQPVCAADDPRFRRRCRLGSSPDRLVWQRQEPSPPP